MIKHPCVWSRERAGRGRVREKGAERAENKIGKTHFLTYYLGVMLLNHNNILFVRIDSHHDREIPRRVETAVSRESRLQVNGDEQIQDRVEQQHHHDVRDAHLVVRRHRHRDVVPRQSRADSLEHDQTLEYVAQRRVGQHGRQQDLSVGHGRVLGLEDHERRVRAEPQYTADGGRRIGCGNKKKILKISDTSQIIECIALIKSYEKTIRNVQRRRTTNTRTHAHARSHARTRSNENA